MGYFSGVECDVCGAVRSWPYIMDKKDVTEWGQDEGWHTNGKTLCPSCVQVKNEQEVGHNEGYKHNQP